MTPDEAIITYSRLSADRQLRVLADHAQNLTILARGTYVSATEEVADPRRLRMFNEVQHCVAGHIRDLLAGNTNRRPDGVLVRVSIDGDDPELLDSFTRALGRWS